MTLTTIGWCWMQQAKRTYPKSREAFGQAIQILSSDDGRYTDIREAIRSFNDGELFAFWYVSLDHPAAVEGNQYALHEMSRRATDLLAVAA